MAGAFFLINVFEANYVMTCIDVIFPALTLALCYYTDI